MRIKTAIQPKRITFAGKRYTLHKRFKIVGRNPQVSEGPFYSRPGVNPADWCWQPDQAFTSGVSSRVSSMNLVQQRTAVESPRPFD